MQLALLTVVVGGGTDGLGVGTASVAVTSAMTLPHSAKGVLVEVVVTTTVEAAVVVVPLHTVVVAMVELGLQAPGIKVVVAP